MKLARILYSDDLVIKEKYKFIDYVKTTNFSEIKFDNKLFNIIIGWENAKKCGATNIFKKEITKNIIWEFSFNEKKSDFYKTLNVLNTIIFDFHYNKIKKTYIIFDDIFKLIDDTTKIFINSNNILYLIKNNIFYICNLKEYCFFNNVSIKNILNLFKFTNIFYDEDTKFLKKMIKRYENVDVEQIKVLLPFLYICHIK